MSVEPSWVKLVTLGEETPELASFSLLSVMGGH